MSAPNGSRAIQDRVVELRRVRAGDLRPNPKNWRRHPESQVRALRGILEQVGYAGALLARETPAGLELIDGHLRAETTPEELVPVLILDLDENEADLVLTTLDPLGGMGEADPVALAALLDRIEVIPEDLERFLVTYLPPEDQAARATAFLDEAAGDVSGAQATWSAPSPDSPYFTITVTVTAEDRTVIRAALDRAKEGLDPPTTQAALVRICEIYMGEG